MNINCVLLYIYGIIRLHPKVSIWGQMVSERNMVPIHRLAIEGS
jgi:hypothetical protein